MEIEEGLQMVSWTSNINHILDLHSPDVGGTVVVVVMVGVVVVPSCFSDYVIHRKI